jgi:hypothetical protein
VKVAVNISGVQLRRAELADLVDDALKAAALPASALELEITESVLVSGARPIGPARSRRGNVAAAGTVRPRRSVTRTRPDAIEVGCRASRTRA